MTHPWSCESQMLIANFYTALAETLDGPAAIESKARRALLAATSSVRTPSNVTALPQPFFDAMAQPDALPICRMIASTPFHWAPPETSTDPRYQAMGASKTHVELVGPDGMAHSDSIRVGLYGIMPNSEYGIRTHPAEEVFLMLAGEAFWKRGEHPFKLHRPGERSHHRSMLPHATRTGDMAFMSAYVWIGDI